MTINETMTMDHLFNLNRESSPASLFQVTPARRPVAKKDEAQLIVTSLNSYALFGSIP